MKWLDFWIIRRVIYCQTQILKIDCSCSSDDTEAETERDTDSDATIIVDVVDTVFSGL